MLLVLGLVQLEMVHLELKSQRLIRLGFRGLTQLKRKRRVFLYFELMYLEVIHLEAVSLESS